MFPKSTTLPLALLSLIAFIFLIISSTIKPYGFFIDELYFMSCSQRLAFGYVDQPPLSIAILSLVIKLFGNNMIAIRVLPALCMAATVFISGLLARRLGGALPSMLLTGLAVMFLPIFLVFTSFYSMNAYEPLLLVSVVFFLVKMVQEDDARYWLHVGILSGIALEMKHTFVLYGFALILGMLISGKRRLLFNRWLLWGALACFMVLLPNIIWQVMNGFPSLELYRNSFTSKNIEKGYFQVILEQVLFISPAAFPLWITGLVALLFSRGKPYRFMFFAYIFLLFVMVSGRSSRPDRIASIYLFFIAYGSVAIELYLKKGWQRVVQVAMAILMIAAGIVLSPIFCPVMQPAQLKQHIASLGLKIEIEEGKKGEPIPQWLADRIGWEEMAAEVSKVYHSLPEAEQCNCVVVSDSYGAAGAFELYSKEFGLPPVYCTHNSFHSWGPPSDSVKTYIGFQIDSDAARELFDSVEIASTSYCPDCTRPQREVPIFILRGPRISVEKEWEGMRNYH
jgi:4-amino-4-deoxy-L-arabinose transferase-like glycosyltransferase